MEKEMEIIKFKDLKVSNQIMQAVEDMGFEEATPIQAQSIPLILEGHDIIGQAQTGTGKTASFGIPMLERLNTKGKKPQALILCPTRELAIQVSDEIAKLAKYMKGVKTVPIYGGAPYDRQIRALKSGVQIVIGTPGRVIDHINRKTLDLSEISMMILDEADEMLNMGFRDDIELVLKQIGTERQTILFSATMPPAIMEITTLYQKNPKIVKVVHKELTATNVDQYYIEAHDRDRVEVASRLFDLYQPRLSLVFCNTKKKVDEVVAQLQTRGYSCERLHGDMKQQQRNLVMDRFRSGNIEILVATDVAARGLDVNHVEMVVNIDVPQDEEYYVHRIGRTGRAGNLGKSFTLVSGREFLLLKDVMKYSKSKIKRHEIPSITDIEEIKTKDMITQIGDIVSNGGLEKYYGLIDSISEDKEITSLEIAAALIKIELEKYKDETKFVADLQGNYSSNGTEDGMVRFFLNVGKTANIKPKDITKVISSDTNLSEELIGQVDIYENFSFFEVPVAYANEVYEILRFSKINGKRIRVDKAKGDGKPSSGGGYKGSKPYPERQSSGGGYKGNKPYGDKPSTGGGYKGNKPYSAEGKTGSSGGYKGNKPYNAEGKTGGYRNAESPKGERSNFYTDKKREGRRKD